MSEAGDSGPGATLARLADSSPSLERLFRLASRVAASQAPVLILGEQGTGRSAFARALHNDGPRAAGPLVEVDPGTLPSTLFEGELFGHRAGAFTGADRSRPGRVAQAEGGTLILDHVEELPLETQPKLLRLLAEGRYAPLGGSEQTADVRFVAIGPDDLPERVESGAFRRDLYHRIEVLAFRLPPVRERRRDLPALLSFFLGDLADRQGRPELRLAAVAREWMEGYSWPGNLRQIRNVLERQAILEAGPELDPEPAPEAERRPGSLAEMERRQIIKALAYTRGHQGHAAEILGISRKSLWEKRKRHGLP